MSTIPTADSLRRQNARIDRRRRAADRVVAAMRENGLALHCSNERFGAVWWLSDGTHVSPEIANLVIINADIASVAVSERAHTNISLRRIKENITHV